MRVELEDEFVYHISNKLHIYAPYSLNKYNLYFEILHHDTSQDICGDPDVTRISILNPEYLKIHNYDTELSNSDIDLLIDTLSNKFDIAFACNCDNISKFMPKYQSVLDLEGKQVNIWQLILFKINEIYSLDNNEWFNPLPYELPIPDYNLLKH